MQDYWYIYKQIQTLPAYKLLIHTQSSGKGPHLLLSNMPALPSAEVSISGVSLAGEHDKIYTVKTENRLT